MTWQFPEREKRIQFSSRARERIFLREKGVCHLCRMKIMAGEAWEVEHPEALSLGGSAAEDDCKVAHVKCHKQKTAKEAGQRAKESRVRQKHIGAHKTKTPLLGSRNHPSGLRKRMNRQVERW